jgi:hypothetical protein
MVRRPCSKLCCYNGMLLWPNSDECRGSKPACVVKYYLLIQCIMFHSLHFIKIFMWFLKKGLVLTKDNITRHKWNWGKRCVYVLSSSSSSSVSTFGIEMTTSVEYMFGGVWHFFVQKWIKKCYAFWEGRSMFSLYFGLTCECPVWQLFKFSEVMK